jgi:hypothetical protein
MGASLSLLGRRAGKLAKLLVRASNPEEVKFLKGQLATVKAKRDLYEIRRARRFRDYLRQLSQEAEMARAFGIKPEIPSHVSKLFRQSFERRV